MERRPRRKKPSEKIFTGMRINDNDYGIEYTTFSKEEKDAVLDKIIDASVKIIDDALMFNPEINRISFLLQSFNDSLKQQEEYENYEACALIKDLIDRIDAA